MPPKFALTEKASDSTALFVLKLKQTAEGLELPRQMAMILCVCRFRCCRISNGVFFINAALFAAASKRFAQGTIKDKDNNLVFQNGRQKLKVKLFDGNGFPDLPEIKHEKNAQNFFAV